MDKEFSNIRIVDIAKMAGVSVFLFPPAAWTPT